MILSELEQDSMRTVVLALAREFPQTLHEIEQVQDQNATIAALIAERDDLQAYYRAEARVVTTLRANIGQMKRERQNADALSEARAKQILADQIEINELRTQLRVVRESLNKADMALKETQDSFVRANERWNAVNACWQNMNSQANEMAAFLQELCRGLWGRHALGDDGRAAQVLQRVQKIRDQLPL